MPQIIWSYPGINCVSTLTLGPDYDGYITFAEAIGWYRYGTLDADGNKQPLFADLSKIDLTGIELKNKPGLKETGRGETINLLSDMFPLKNENRLNAALVYGHITLYAADNNRVCSIYDTYDFDMHQWSLKNSFRNIETILGKLVATAFFVCSGTSFDIKFYGNNKVKIKSK